MRRIPGAAYIGRQRYLLTICTYQKRRTFESATVVGIVIEQILRVAHEVDFAVIAYCCMPDHLHQLVEGKTADASLVGFVHRSKQMSGYHARGAAGVRIWQRGYHDRILPEVEDTRSVARYIVNNPVRAGLVNAPDEYEFTGSGVFDREGLWDFAGVSRPPTVGT